MTHLKLQKTKLEHFILNAIHTIVLAPHESDQTGGKNNVTFLRGGWAEFHQTGDEGSQTIPPGQVYF